MDDVGRTLRSLAALAALCIIMGFFTACGNALLGLSDRTVQELAEKSKKGKRIKRLNDQPDIIVQTNLAARTAMMIVFAGVMTEYLFLPLVRRIADSFDGAVCGLLCILTAAVIAGVSASLIAACAVSFPRRLCESGRPGENFVVKAFGIYSVFLAFFLPLRLISLGAYKLLLKIFGVPSDKEVTEEEILDLLDAANESGGIEEEQAEMISNIFEFSDLEVHDVMTHRTEIAAVECNAPVSEAVRVSVETGVSRIPVYEETIDNIRGVIYIKDLLPLILEPQKAEGNVSQYLHKVKFVPESAECGELFSYFTENKKQIAVVIDEYGGTAGLVTMEDLLESIVGNIRDEYDENEAEDVQEITPNTFDISGSADPDEVMELLGHTLPDEHDYDTIGGFVTDLLGFIPEDGQTPAVKYKNITFLVIKAEDNRIVKLRAMREHAAADED